MNETNDQRVAQAESSPPTDPPPSRLITGTLVGVALVAVVAVLMIGQRESAVSDPPQAAVQRLPNSIAVLPFVDLSDERDQEYFGDGLAEEILNLLGRSPELKVIARTSSFRFKHQPADIATITRRLGVTHVLEGSVRKSGNQVRITAQLIAAQDGAQVWSQNYDRELGDLLATQREIAVAVAHALRTRLLREEAAPPAPTVAPTVNVQAYDYFLQGHYMFQRRDAGDLARAREQFEAAVALEPGYARAWAGLSGVFDAQTHQGEISREYGVTRRRETAERALELDPDLAEAHLHAIAVSIEDGDIERAQHHFHLALALEPNNALLLELKSSALAARGRIAEAIELWDRVVATDPLSRESRINRATHLMGAGQLEEARADLLVAGDLGAGGDEASTRLALIKVLERRYQEALDSLGPIARSYDRELGLALTHHALGNGDESAAIVARLRADNAAEAALALAQVFAHWGEQEEAFTWLTEARSRFSQGARDAGHWARLSQLSPFLRPLHDDPRWAELYTEEQPLL
jgi:adenylate cyclase